MPILTDLAVVRSLLNRDRAWAAYAIGDLTPGMAEHCEWRVSADRESLLLVYRGFTPPITFAMGKPEQLRTLFDEIAEPWISLQVPEEAIAAMSNAYSVTFTRPMKRMAVTPESFAPVPADGVREIGGEHLAAVHALYEDGDRRNERPAFFYAGMLEQKTFRGIWEGDDVVAIAGSHLCSPAEGVCAIGNVYTRHDRRGRGLGTRVTSAVVRHAVTLGVSTIVLNVGKDNVSAQRMYERLGFEHCCDFIEGEANRHQGSAR